MDPQQIEVRFERAQSLCRSAGAIARVGFRAWKGITVDEKGLHDLVTSVDLEIDAFLRAELSEAFPADGVLTEESAGSAAAVLWVIDPIDGTQNFARGIAHFAISVALVCDGVVQLGLVYNPVTDEMFAARRGGGAFLNGVSIRVSSTALPRSAIVDTGYSTNLPNADYLSLLGRVLDASYGFLQQGSAALGLAQVACGRIDGYVEAHLFSWDVLAGILLVEEAGGWASAFPADRGLDRGHPILACTPALRENLERVAQTERWGG